MRLRPKSDVGFRAATASWAGQLFCLISFIITTVLAPVLAAEQAQDAEPEVVRNAAVQQPASNEGSVIEVPVAPIIIEAEPLNVEPSLDQLMERFRGALATPPSFLITERPLAAGGLEVYSRFGRFCVDPLPPQSSGGPGGDVRLVARCASY